MKPQCLHGRNEIMTLESHYLRSSEFKVYFTLYTSAPLQPRVCFSTGKSTHFVLLCNSHLSASHFSLHLFCSHTLLSNFAVERVTSQYITFTKLTKLSIGTTLRSVYDTVCMSFLYRYFQESVISF